ncbi:glycogen synthase [Patescibacteria group bacterium]|nr:glycogen synthase [Patescibacteria group bacterium]
MPTKKPLKILFLSAEVAPIAKVGGLGDVAGALPKELIKLGVDLKICLPYYGFIDSKKYKIKKVQDKIKVPFNKSDETISIWKTYLPDSKVEVYLIKHKYFNAKKVYVGGRIMHGAKYSRGQIDTERFSFFTRASLQVARAIGFQPNVIHAQDWHTALAGDYLKTITNPKHKSTQEEIEITEFFKNTKTLYTIHNLANQGISNPKIIGISEIDPNLEIIKADKKDGDINFMVQGILGSDLVNTVSPKYAQEILHHYLGAGLDNILIKRKKDLYGILNGIDTDFFNPQEDKFIYKKYSAKNLENKTENKLYLQKQLGLTVDKNIPLLGLVSRLVWQKGTELIDDKFGDLNCQYVFLGTGQPEYENHLRAFAKKYPKNVKTLIKFDVKLAQLIYAASDMFLMPSRFEPCGLGQMIAMRYGAVPVARSTGGIANTVFSPRLFQLRRANGFTFEKYTSESFYRALNRALTVYHDKPKKWKTLQLNGMKEDFSWNKSAREYIKLYEKLAK